MRIDKTASARRLCFWAAAALVLVTTPGAAAVELRSGDLLAVVCETPACDSESRAIVRIDTRSGGKTLILRDTRVRPIDLAAALDGSLLLLDAGTTGAGLLTRFDPATGELAVVSEGGLLRGAASGVGMNEDGHTERPGRPGRTRRSANLLIEASWTAIR